MTKENLITVPVGHQPWKSQHILHQHRVEKLLVVNDAYELKGLITVKDIQKKLRYPNACKDSQGRACGGGNADGRLPEGLLPWWMPVPTRLRSTPRMGTRGSGSGSGERGEKALSGGKSAGRQHCYL